MEIEKKFLVLSLPDDLEQYDNHIIKQWYISKVPEIRLRQAGRKYWLTLKSKGGLVRTEHEVALRKQEFVNLLPSATTEVIHKTRYKIPLQDKLIAELDIFHSKAQANLVTVEVEFASEQAAHNFTPPKWFGKDITEDSSYKNRNLAANLPEKVRQKLVQYYKTIDQLFSSKYIETFHQFDRDVIHKLRVSIKKLRALFSLLAALSDQVNAKKAYRPIRQVFRKAGAIRDLQVQQKLLKQYEKKFELDLSDHIDRLFTKEQDAKANFLVFKKQNYFTVLKQHSDYLLRNLQSLNLEALNAQLSAYFQTLFQQIFQLIDLPNKEAEQLHDLRKLLKELNYNLLLVSDIRGVPLADKKSLKNLDALQELLGDWHDTEVALLNLEAFKKQLADNASFQELYEELEHSYANYIEQIEEALQHFKQEFTPTLTKL